VTKDDIGSALANTKSDLGNEVLYCLCSTYPYHKKDEEIIAKIWLISRAYAATLERHKKENAMKGDDFLEIQIPNEFKKSGIDQLLEQIKNQPTSEGAIEAHFELVDSICCKFCRHKTTSFASKYLHFHQRHLFYIYDNRSVKTIKNLAPKSKKDLPVISPKKSVLEYENFYRRCLWLKENVMSRFNQSLSPRDIDKLLLYLHKKWSL